MGILYSHLISKYICFYNLFFSEKHTQKNVPVCPSQSLNKYFHNCQFTDLSEFWSLFLSLFTAFVGLFVGIFVGSDVGIFVGNSVGFVGISVVIVTSLASSSLLNSTQIYALSVVMDLMQLIYQLHL